MKHKSASHSLLTCLLVVLAFAVYSSSAVGADTTWNTGGDDWFGPTNWTAGRPSSCIDAFINNGGSAKMDHGSAMARTLTLGEDVGASGTVTVDGASSILSVGAPRTGSCEVPDIFPGEIQVGNGGSGTLNIANGGRVDSGGGYVARLGGGGTVEPSNGAVTVDGAGSIWSVTGQLFIGGTGSTDGGIALLNVTNGGTVSVSTPVAATAGLRVGISGTITGNGLIAVSGNNEVNRRTNVAGTLAPSGTLSIGGNLSLIDSPTTRYNVTPQVQDRVNVLGGEARLKGHVSVTMTGDFRGGQPYIQYILLDATGPRIGRFETFSITYPTDQGFTPHIRYGTNHVYLDVCFQVCPQLPPLELPPL